MTKPSKGRLFLALIAASVAALLLAPTAGVGQASAATTPAQADPVTPVPMGVEDAVDNVGQRSYPDSYGGMAVINDRTQIAVYLTDTAPDIETAFEQHAPAGLLVFRSTPHSLEELTALSDRIQSQWDDVTAKGVKVVEFGPNILIGKEDVGVENLTDAQAQKLRETFGAGALNIYNVSPADLASRQLDVTRTSDTAPYNGGDAIGVYGVGGCTSGFGIKINGHRRLLTAGHCFPTGDHVYNMKLGSSGWYGSKRRMGTVTQRAFPGGQLDSEVFTGCNGSGTCGGSDLIFTGAIGNPQIAVVSGKGSWHDGDQVCESGAYGGERCDFVVKRVNYCTTLEGYRLCHVTRTYKSGQNAVSGDSGAPVFRFSNGLRAVGTHTAHDGSHHEWFTGINAILSRFGATLNTG